MRIEVARAAGACYGVQRALDMALKVAATAEGPVHTLGPLIHNPRVVADLAAHGVTAIDDVHRCGEGSTVLLRTHGVTPEVEDAARATGATVLDATCPFVTRCHRLVERIERDGYQVVVVGEKGHPEVEGTVGHARGVLVVESLADLEGAELSRRVGVVVQTTQTKENLRSVVSSLVGRVEELWLHDTICDATSERQEAAAELAARADVMIVVGGRNSANTCHLAQVCSGHCAKVHHIEAPEELEAAWFEGADLVGVTAGASTPQAHIEEMETAIQALAGPEG